MSLMSARWIIDLVWFRVRFQVFKSLACLARGPSVLSPSGDKNCQVRREAGSQAREAGLRFKGDNQTQRRETYLCIKINRSRQGILKIEIEIDEAYKRAGLAMLLDFSR